MNTIEAFKKELEHTDNIRDVLRLLREIKYVAILWFKKKNLSDRTIAHHLNLSNTRVSQIIKTVKIL